MAPGHDAPIIGDEPCVVIDWQGFADSAKRLGKQPTLWCWYDMRAWAGHLGGR